MDVSVLLGKHWRVLSAEHLDTAADAGQIDLGREEDRAPKVPWRVVVTPVQHKLSLDLGGTCRHERTEMTHMGLLEVGEMVGDGWWVEVAVD